MGDLDGTRRRKTLRDKLAKKAAQKRDTGGRKKRADDDESDASAGSDSDEPVDELTTRLRALTKSQLIETLLKLDEKARGSASPLEKEKLKAMDESELRTLLHAKLKPPRQACSKFCLAIGLIFIFFIFWLRLSEELYNPGMEEIESHFRVLGLTGDATDRDIRSAYRKKAREMHPDKNPGCADCADRLVQINDAYELLTTEKHINRYRTYRKNRLKVASEQFMDEQEFIKRGGKKDPTERQRRRRHTKDATDNE